MFCVKSYHRFSNTVFKHRLTFVVHADTEIFYGSTHSISALFVQGSEKTNWRSRAIFQNHTNHGGGRNRENPHLQVVVFEHRHRRHRKRAVAQKLERAAKIKEARLAKEPRAKAWKQLDAAEGVWEWLKTRVRVGSRWYGCRVQALPKREG
jgi:hypothetical protein